MLQGTRDTRRRVLTAGRQSSPGETPGSAHGSAPARSAPGGHRASRPAATAGRRRPGLPPAPPPRETCNKRRGSRGAHWLDGAGRGGTGRDGAGTPLKGSPALPGRPAFPESRELRRGALLGMQRTGRCLCATASWLSKRSAQEGKGMR